MGTRFRLLASAVTATTLLAWSGCGSHDADPKSTSQSHTSHPPTSLPIDPNAKPQPGGADQSGPVVAWVGHTPITRAALLSRMEIEARTEEEPAVVPVPPAYTACVARLAVAAPVASSSSGQLVSRCRRRYQSLLSRVLGTLIAFERLIHQAAKEGVKPTDQQIRQRLEVLKAEQFGSEAAFKAFLAQSGENVPDLLFNIEEELANTAVRNKIREHTQRVSPATAASYYAAHKRKFFVPEQRDLGIIRTKTAAVAKRVKHELDMGASFESVAKGLPNTQSVGTKNGLLTGLEPGVYAERKLNDAILSAPLHKLRGPVKLSLFSGVHFPKPRGDIQDVDGYYIFEVFEIRPAHLTPLAQVKTGLEQTLPRVFEKQAVAAYVKRYRASWIPLTNCKPEYVVRKCRQFTRKPGEQPEDAYTFN
jgi:foldase protein PrsA